MKKIYRFPAVILLILSVFIIHSCKKEDVPTLTTSAITNITTTSVTTGGTITSEGSSTIIVRGVCWSTGTSPTIADNKTTDGAGAGSFTSELAGLTAGTTYYVRAFATNANGTGYGMTMSFTTLPATLPVLTTANVITITQNSASCGGTITSDGAASITARGVCWSTLENPSIALSTKTTDGIGTGVFTSSIVELTTNTTYHVRAYATNSAGTAYGNEISFTTTSIPTLTTTEVSLITLTTATCGGNITSDGGAIITAKGVCWSTLQNPTIANSNTTDGTGTGAFISSITGLTLNTIYYVRAYAINSVGTGYGQQIQFASSVDYTGQIGTVNDIDGNTYPTIGIGSQIWMIENLKTTKYKDGTAIPMVPDNTAWIALSTPAYCWYNNDAQTYMNTYGALYNWYTVNTGKLCPSGWHIPTHSEWTILITYLGGESVAGGKLKEIGTTHWNSYNTGSNNESGYTALPGGLRHGALGTSYNVGNSGYWWSSTVADSGNVWSLLIPSSGTAAYETYYGPKNGYSVRCLRD